MKKIILSVFYLLFLTSCYVFMPVPEGYKGQLATVADSMQQQSSTKVYFFELEKVDNRDVRMSSFATYDANYAQGFSMKPVLVSRDVPAKKSVLLIKGTTHFAAPILAFGGGNYNVSGKVIVNLLPGRKYTIKGKLSKRFKAVWVEDQYGAKVSKIIKK